MRVSFGVWVAAGLVAGALAAGAVVASGALDDGVRSGGGSHERDSDEDAEAVAEARAADAAAFVDAYERSRTGTYVVESLFERTFPSGNGFSSTATIVQRPPDRVERRLGSVTARVDGRVVLCSTTAEGRYRCQSGRSRRSYRTLVEREVDTLRGYVEGDVPLYAVAADEDPGPSSTGGDQACFDLEQVRTLPTPPYGTAARFCFDDGTGALVELRIEREEAVDVTTATAVRGTVRDADVDPPRDGDRAPAVADPDA